MILITENLKMPKPMLTKRVLIASLHGTTSSPVYWASNTKCPLQLSVDLHEVPVHAYRHASISGAPKSGLLFVDNALPPHPRSKEAVIDHCWMAKTFQPTCGWLVQLWTNQALCHHHVV